MSFQSYLLRFHGVAETIAGIAMIVATERVFPVVIGQSVEIQFLGKFFGAAILSLGITGILARPSPQVLLGALSYHATIASLFARLLQTTNVVDSTGSTTAAVFHGLVALLFGFAWLTYRPTSTTRSTPSLKRG